ncbi:MAG: tRNA (adenosine(37)-N6)-threonylcarbamoyltransferase complex dimerization subunit type 1 TsaB [Candidatus Nanopelagicales bacterium]|nr:tRNA (adenosine(37)-N6)-threonylcarbamoyltransferase complex dimerization subunit type 1 TsaB [Candidatus Nanopelagicales bacterium]
MLVLALDSATSAPCVGVVSGDGSVRIEATGLEGIAGEVLLPAVDSLLIQAGIEKHSLTHVAVGVGPGPYTSTRVGVMVATTIAHALSIPIAGICTHDAIAAAVVSQTLPTVDFGVATDARRRETYWARYDCRGARRTGPVVTKPAEMLERADLAAWAGDGLDRNPELVREHRVTVIADTLPQATILADLAIAAWRAGEEPGSELPPTTEHGNDGAGLVSAQRTLLPPHPIYLRRPDAKPQQLPANQSAGQR